MLSLSGIYALVVVFVVSCSQLALAHSTHPRPLKRVAHPSTIALEILPRHPAPITSYKRSPALDSQTLRYDDSFRLIISAFSDKFHLHLRPNDDLIQPAARITYHTTNPDGTISSHTEPLLRETVKAYWGEVIEAGHSSTRLREDAAHVVPHPHPAILGWARIMVHHQGDMDLGIPPEFEGAFSALGDVYHVMTKDNYLRNKHPLDPDVSETLDDDSNLVIWRESDVMTAEEERHTKDNQLLHASVPVAHSCGHDRLPFNTDPYLNDILQKPLTPAPWYSAPLAPFNNATILPRDDVAGNGMGTNFIDSIGSTGGCPKTQKVILMGVAADCVYVQKYGSQANATKQILTSWNSASTLYKTTFNISLGIIEVQVQQPTCPNTPDPSFPWNVPCAGTELDNRLSLFSKWRGDKGGEDGVGLWHLMSGCPTGSEVGIAWLGTLCQTSTTGSAPNFVSGAAVSTAGLTEWQVIAHEIGHNFGAIHDCNDNCTLTASCCPRSTSSCSSGADFLMSPVAQPGEKTFSPCTIGNICSLMGGVTNGKVDTSCLVDPDPTRATLGLNMCGNGIVEQGEQCDPGSGIESPCCDSATCKFKGNAVCDPQSSPCCTSQCAFAPSTQMCRPQVDPKCDTAEFCTGNSSACPADVTAPNGQSCGSNDLKCASGQCTSVSLQCQTVGASMGLKQACPNRGDNTCQVSCQDPNKTNQCVLLTSLLIDGSPCGFGGTCVAGKCQAAGFLDTAKAWYMQNLQIAIPVTVVAGLVAILLLWAMFKSMRRCCWRQPKSVPVADPVLRPTGMRTAYDERSRAYDRPAGLRAPGIPPILQPGNPR
ncbi:hypothetical protein BDN72DRAFT_872 [Pluteus cervinus]|uniref:Uncharacterized protein n=1 Tax=Pluteus cervinus TaxID=181527 RepID=A0ACD3BFI0_9AGAR|nr:hypothetical protein BDN72DRAFT_872 [Pluteus cervinus]